MPITPFHMGPGLLVKAVGGRHVSLMVFGFSQVAMDIEPAVRMIRDDLVLHGFTHTFLGATLIGLMSAVVGRPVGQALLDRWAPDPGAAFETWLRGPKRISWPAAVVGAFVGTYSHVVLDSVMHADMQPLAPFSGANALLGVIAPGALHVGCALAGVLGALLLVTAFFRRPSADWPPRHRVWYRSHVETLADRQIVSTRVVDAPRARVFRAWTDPAHLARWWGPSGFTNTFHEFDLRPGGTWRFVMRAPDGAEFQNESVFVEIVAPERIVFRHESPPAFQVTATFAEQAGKTRISFQMLFETADACEKVRSFAPEANEQNFDRLEAELTRMS